MPTNDPAYMREYMRDRRIAEASRKLAATRREQLRKETEALINDPNTILKLTDEERDEAVAIAEAGDYQAAQDYVKDRSMSIVERSQRLVALIKRNKKMNETLAGLDTESVHKLCDKVIAIGMAMQKEKDEKRRREEFEKKWLERR